MPKNVYRLKGNTHTDKDGNKYERGDEIVCEPEEIEGFKDKFELVKENAKKKESGAEPASTDEDEGEGILIINGVRVQDKGRGWYELPDGKRIRGEKALEKALRKE